ncbi:hypothetical protein BT69DRAFT_1350103 [Atractiella rhizophila]|nr:hypothetical protein BT69DRAFT_1350103 [Atractiella rhizophila]
MEDNLVVGLGSERRRPGRIEGRSPRIKEEEGGPPGLAGRSGQNIRRTRIRAGVTQEDVEGAERETIKAEVSRQRLAPCRLPLKSPGVQANHLALRHLSKLQAATERTLQTSGNKDIATKHPATRGKGKAGRRSAAPTRYTRSTSYDSPPTTKSSNGKTEENVYAHFNAFSQLLVSARQKKKKGHGFIRSFSIRPLFDASMLEADLPILKDRILSRPMVYVWLQNVAKTFNSHKTV